MRDNQLDVGRQRVYQCPVEIPIAVVGGKWKPILLFWLLEAPRRNGELLRLVPTITQKMLTQQLRELEEDGIIKREILEQVPPRVEYSIIESEQKKLRSLIRALCNWGIYWAEQTNARVLDLEKR